MKKKLMVSLSLMASMASMVLFTGANSASSAQSASSIISSLPDAIKSQYVGVADTVSLSTYSNFKKVAGPWTVCYSESYVGNPWRVSLANEIKRLAALYKTAGLVSDFKMSVSDNDVARQSQQIRQFATSKCSVIITVAGSATALNSAISAAKAKGIPVITIAGAVTSPWAVNVDSNYAVMGAELAASAVKASKNVVMVKGIEGSPIATQQNDATKAVFKAKGATVVAEVNGNWTPSITKDAILNVITKNSGDIGAIWTTGSETAIIAQAFKDAGRPAPVIMGSISGDAIGFWKANPSDFKFDGVALMPTWTAQTGFNVAMRVLSGQGPILSTMMVPVPHVTSADLAGMWKACMTPTAGSIFPVVPKDPLPANLMNAYFKKGAPVGPFDYAKTPDPCAA